MTWYKLIFKQNQPIHIGSTKWGVVKETDLFISGQTMWGALTNAHYQKNGTYDENKFKTISNFFPSLDGEIILKPSYENGEFYLGNVSEEEFRAYFVDTYVQTAIEPVSRKAKNESLHEIDFILPRPKKDFQGIEKLELLKNQLYWVGIIKTDDNFLKKGFKIYVGSDVRYGYGELELVDVKPLAEEDKKIWWIDDENITLKTNEPSPYFIELDNNSNFEFEGEILLLTEMNFQKNTPEVNNAKFYIAVGSKVISSNGAQNQVILEKGKIKFSSNNQQLNNQQPSP